MPVIASRKARASGVTISFQKVCVAEAMSFQIIFACVFAAVQTKPASAIALFERSAMDDTAIFHRRPVARIMPRPACHTDVAAAITKVFKPMSFQTYRAGLITTYAMFFMLCHRLPANARDICIYLDSANAVHPVANLSQTYKTGVTTKFPIFLAPCHRPPAKASETCTNVDSTNAVHVVAIQSATWRSTMGIPVIMSETKSLAESHTWTASTLAAFQAFAEYTRTVLT